MSIVCFRPSNCQVHRRCVKDNALGMLERPACRLVVCQIPLHAKQGVLTQEWKWRRANFYTCAVYEFRAQRVTLQKKNTAIVLKVHIQLSSEGVQVFAKEQMLIFHQGSFKVALGNIFVNIWNLDKKGKKIKSTFAPFANTCPPSTLSGIWNTDSPAFFFFFC